MIRFEDTKEQLQGVSEWLKNEYSSIHTGKASPAVLDGIYVESYGSRQPIKNIASITIEDAKTLRVNPWDSSVISGIERAIVEADLGLSCSVDGKGMRIIFPHLTEETRQKIVKVLKNKLEDARISVRKERERKNDEIDSAFKEKDITEDERIRARESLQEFITKANSDLEVIYNAKEVSVMTI